MSLDNIVSVGVTVLLFVLGGFVSFQNNRIKSLEDRLDLIDGRIDDVKDNYVRRDDNNSAISRVEKAIDDVKADLKVLMTLVLERVQKSTRGA